MDYSKDHVFQALQFGPDTTAGSDVKKIVFSPDLPFLMQAATVLSSGMGDTSVLELTEVAPGMVNDGEKKTRIIRGKGQFLGKERNVTIYIRHKAHDTVLDFVLLLTKYDNGYKPSDDFSDVQNVVAMRSLVLDDGFAIISYGLPENFNDSVTVKQSDGSDSNLSLGGYLFRDGLQIFGTDSTFAQTLWTSALGTIQGHPLPAPDTYTDNPIKVCLSIDQIEQSFQLDGWWEVEKPARFSMSDLFKHGVRAKSHFDASTGTYGLVGKPLIELGSSYHPVMLTGAAMPDDTVRYSFEPLEQLRFSDQQSEAFLRTFFGTKANNLFFNSLKVPLPAAFRLKELNYEPDKWASFTLATDILTTEDGQYETYRVALGPFNLTHVEIRFDIHYQQRTAIWTELDCWLHFLGVDWLVHYRHNYLLEGGIAEPSGVRVGHLLDGLFPTGFPVQFESLTLTEARLSRVFAVDGAAGETAFVLRLAGRVPLFSDAIILSGLELDVTVPDKAGGKGIDPSNSYGSFAGDLELGPVKITFSAVRSGSAWTLAGGAQFGDEGVSLTELVNHLVTTLGATVPADVPDLRLSSVAISYATSSHALMLEGVAEFEVEDGVPVFAGKSTVMLQLEVVSTGSGRETAVSLQWRLDKTVQGLPRTGESNPIDVIVPITAGAHFSRTSQMLTLDLSAPDEIEVLKLSDLATSLDLPSLPASDSLDTIFQLTHFSMNLTRPGNSFGVAWSRPLKAGVLVAEYEHGTRALTQSGMPKRGSRNRNVKVSWSSHEAGGALGIADLFALVGGDEATTALQTYFPTSATQLLSFSQFGFRYVTEGVQRSITFTGRSTYRDGTDTFITIQRGRTKGVVAGFVLGGGTSASTALSDLPFTIPDVVTQIVDTVDSILDHVELTHVIVSTVAAQRFQTPTFSPSAYQATGEPGVALTTSQPFGVGEISLIKGVAVGFKVKFGRHPLLSRIIDFDELYAQVALSSTHVGFKISIPDTLALDVGGGNSLALNRAALEIQKGKLDTIFRLGGDLELQLFGESVEVGGWLALSQRGISANLQLDDVSLPPIPMMPGVRFKATEAKPMHLLLGLSFQPPAINLGIQAHFYLHTAVEGTLNWGKVGFVLEVMKGAAHPKYIEFALDSLTIMTVLEVFTGVNFFTQLAQNESELVGDVLGGPFDDLSGSVAKGADTLQTALEHIEAIVSDVEIQQGRFHWADNIVYLPDGTTAMPGVGFRGGVKFFGWNAYASFNFSLQGTPGFEGHIETEPFDIPDVVRIWGAGKGVKLTPDGVTVVDPKQQVDRSNQPYLLEPGGPVLHVSTNSSPFIFGDLHAELFGFLQADIHAEVSTDGFAFHFGVGAGDGVRADLACHWWRETGRFEALGALDVNLQGTLGPLIPGVSLTEFEIDTSLEASIRLAADSERFSCAVDGSFEFQGVTLELPELTLTVPFKSLEELAATIWDWLQAQAEDIFEEFLLPVGAFIAESAEMVADVAVAGATAVAALAEQGVQKAAELLEKPIGLITDVGSELANSATELANLTQQTISQASQLATEAAQDIIDAADALADTAVELGTKVAAEVAAIGNEIKAIGAAAATFVAAKAKEAAEYVLARIDEAKRWVDARLKQAKALANELAREAAAVVANIKREIDKLIKEIDRYASMIADFLLDLGNDVGDGLAAAGGFVVDTFDDWF